MQNLEEDKAKAIESNRRLKETLSHSKQVYEKEIRRARKEAFKASSDGIRLHEELKSSRDSENNLRSQLESTRETVATAEKEAFSARYKLIEIDEELQKMQQTMKAVEEERDALKTSLKEEEVARIAAEGRIPLPTPATPDEFTSPKKKRPVMPTPTPKRHSRKVETEWSASHLKAAEKTIVELRELLKAETHSKKNAEDLVDFMKLECQLKRCCCRRAEEVDHKPYVFDNQFEAVITSIRKEIETFEVSHKPSALHQDRDRPRRPKKPEHGRPKTPSRHLEEDLTTAVEPLVEFSPVTGTFRTISSPTKAKVAEQKETRPQPQPTPPPEDLSNPSSIIPSIAPVAISASPSILSLSETTTTITNKNSTDDCQVLATDPAPASSRPLPDREVPIPRPSTPQKSSPALSRPSDADLLSFTPFNPSTTFPQSHFQSDPELSTAGSGSSCPQPPPLPHSQSYILSTTTITTIPLAAEPATPSSKTFAGNPSFTAGYSPGTTKTREEARECIEKWRRGRSRSVVLGGTPKRFGAAGVGTPGAGVGSGVGQIGMNGGPGGTPGKRDCSAPVGRVTRREEEND